MTDAKLAAPVLQSLSLLDGAMSSEESKMATRLIIRNPHGYGLFATLFGRPLPESVVNDLAQLGELARNERTEVPPYATTGDVIWGEKRAEVEEVDKWFVKALKGLKITSESAIDKHGVADIEEFSSRYVLPHVTDKGSWKLPDTIMLVLLLYSYHDFEVPLHLYYGDRLAQSIVPSLLAYKVSKKRAPLRTNVRAFDLTLVLFVMQQLLQQG